MELEIRTVAERPELASMLSQISEWPRFMTEDPVSSLYYADPETAYPEFVLGAVDRDAPDQLVAKAFSVPFSWEDDPARSLPEGWDGVILRATRDRLAGRRGNLVSAIEISVRSSLRGKGLSALMLDAMRRNAARLGFTDLVAPVRPNGKHRHPHMPIAEYAAWRREDGLPVDPWLRVHVRAGGRILRIAECSMVIPGTLDDWREWTGLPFDTSGTVLVPHALTPVHCDVALNQAVYVEPNVWVQHRLSLD